MNLALVSPLTGFIEKTFVITEFELRKLRHDFTELITRAFAARPMDADLRAGVLQNRDDA